MSLLQELLGFLKKYSKTDIKPNTKFEIRTDGPYGNAASGNHIYKYDVTKVDQNDVTFNTSTKYGSRTIEGDQNKTTSIDDFLNLLNNPKKESK